MRKPPRSRRDAAAASIPNSTTPNSQVTPNSATPKTPKQRTRSVEVRRLPLGVRFLTLRVLGVVELGVRWELWSWGVVELTPYEGIRAGPVGDDDDGARCGTGAQASCASKTECASKTARPVRPTGGASDRGAQSGEVGRRDCLVREGREAEAVLRRRLLVSGHRVLHAAEVRRVP